MFRTINMIVAVFFLLIARAVSIAQTEILENDEIVVIYEPGLKIAAEGVVQNYSIIRAELNDIFGWYLTVKPQVILIKSNQNFQRMTHNELFVAFAVPAKKLIAIDYSRMHTYPFTLFSTLKHELCHLLLHDHIADENLPKWLDEGVCQWASDGIAEIIMNSENSILNTAILSGRKLNFASMTNSFPHDKMSLMLAYEQSKSIVEFINNAYGKKAILDILGYLRDGETVDTAVFNSISLSMDDLEKKWFNHLRGMPIWLAFIANHLYGILFFLAAVITIFGFFRLLIRKRAYHEEDDDDNDGI